jgi:ribosomal protein S18 acetylase RimI-like enzyme
MTVRVRPATSSEYAVAGDICVEAYRADGQLADEHDYAVTLIDVATRAEHAEVLVAVDEHGVLGCVTLARPGSRYSGLATPSEAEFRMLAVAPSAQGRGVGAALVRACFDRARELGYRGLVISVRDFNDTAKRLYARFGFVRVPERDFTPVPGVFLEALRVDL